MSVPREDLRALCARESADAGMPACVTVLKAWDAEIRLIRPPAAWSRSRCWRVVDASDAYPPARPRNTLIIRAGSLTQKTLTRVFHCQLTSLEARKPRGPRTRERLNTAQSPSCTVYFLQYPNMHMLQPAASLYFVFHSTLYRLMEFWVGTTE